MRLRRDPEALTKLRSSKYLVQNFPFKLNQNFIIELAMGKGQMIINLAQNHPENFYLGVEKEATIALKAAALAENLNLINFKIICDDIKNLVNLVQGKVNTIYLTFPDPWPKNRHSKKRLTNNYFLEIYQKILTKNGVLKFKTDNSELWEYTLKQLISNNWQIIYQTNNLHSDFKMEENVLTNYEVKWSNSGKNIYYLEAKIPKIT